MRPSASAIRPKVSEKTSSTAGADEHADAGAGVLDRRRQLELGQLDLAVQHLADSWADASATSVPMLGWSDPSAGTVDGWAGFWGEMFDVTFSTVPSVGCCRGVGCG